MYSTFGWLLIFAIVICAAESGKKLDVHTLQLEQLSFLKKPKPKPVSVVEDEIVSDEFVQGTLRQLPTSTVESRPFPDPKACDSSSLTVCVGCQTIKICISPVDPNSIDDPNPTQLCPSKTPFCSTKEGSCSATPDDTVIQCSDLSVASDFKCTSAGKFPSPTSCNEYYYCENKGDSGSVYQCPPLYTYNTIVQACQLRILNTSCKNITCPGTNTIFNPYPSNTQYFYYCMANPNDATLPQTPVMYTCGKNAKFDATQQKCIYQCTAEGSFPNPNKPSSYYQCYRSGLRILSRELNCKLSTQVFNSTLQVCTNPPAATVSGRSISLVDAGGRYLI
ncbi:uncharacterized protein LOC129749662 [Uranotaenia lowii]|uniref:uncharacterized protein LOC129749662 n=1 Tax=Uranotaenia lowii TaxID=190385 RepID=UPI00247A7D95|nr:uncharacterized protein LOC129749662 [Uranotaenia lowii]